MAGHHTRWPLTDGIGPPRIGRTQGGTAAGGGERGALGLWRATVHTAVHLHLDLELVVVGQGVDHRQRDLGAHGRTRLAVDTAVVMPLWSCRCGHAAVVMPLLF